MAICKLCNREKDLIKKSHIIPDFMYRDLYDENHKLITFSPYQRFIGKGKIKRPSTGEYESGILCQECDRDIIGAIYEDYASKALFGGNLSQGETPISNNYINQNGINFSIISNISYVKFKLFLLSILWRASISTRPVFSEISLGPHQEIIRKMIYEGDPKEIDDYPINFFSYINDKSMPRDIVAQPRAIKSQKGYRYYYFLINGILYVFNINSKDHKLPELVLETTIKPNNEMTVVHFPKGTGMDIILRYFGIK